MKANKMFEELNFKIVEQNIGFTARRYERETEDSYDNIEFIKPRKPILEYSFRGYSQDKYRNKRISPLLITEDLLKPIKKQLKEYKEHPIND